MAPWTEQARGLRECIKDLSLSHLWIIYPGADSYELEKQVSVISMDKISQIRNALSSPSNATD